MKEEKRYTKGEEIANTSTHALGIALGMVMGTLFIVMATGGGDRLTGWSIGLYLFGMLGSYIASCLYHASPQGSPRRARLRKLDHAAIYWHIAGSYSPITLLAMRQQGYWGNALFIFIWSAAIAGTIVTLVGLRKHSYVETICYVLMGLSVLVAFSPLYHSAGLVATSWIIAEGVMYCTGAVFYSIYKRKYMHTIFHVFVLLGSICHIVAVWDILSNYLQRAFL